MLSGTHSRPAVMARCDASLVPKRQQRGHALVNSQHDLNSLVAGRHCDPFSVLGPHYDADGWCVRCWFPGASEVQLLLANGSSWACKRVHPQGVFMARCHEHPGHYRLQVDVEGEVFAYEDPYRFASTLGDVDRHLLAKGTHQRLADALGASVCRLDGIAGVRFGVWAPNAKRVSVVGPFNHWDGRRHPMRLHPGIGVWELFIPDLADGDLYKYELVGACDTLLPLKADPLARQMEPPPGNASIVAFSDYEWRDRDWIEQHRGLDLSTQPVAIYELHLGSWRRTHSGKMLGYRELAHMLVPYVVSMGYTHIELLPVAEHPFDGSWGYQPVGMFAPTHRFGSPDDFKYFVDYCHQHDVSVILDWVPAHFPKDAHGLAQFDGTCLYEHADPRQGEHADWGTLIYNFARPEVVNYLVASALWWIDEYHIDGLRVDAVASMLYLDYSREDGEWVANQFGGNENLEAVAFVRRLNERLHQAGAFSIAEESTSWPQVSRPARNGGLGFMFKWNMGWMHDTLHYMSEASVHRRYHQDCMTFGLMYAFSENFVLALSHDEVVHGKGSMLAKMSGDRWQQFANLRAYYAFMYAYPGKKLMFMGGELAQLREWDHDGELDWGALDDPLHGGVQSTVRDLNHLYRNIPALHVYDCRDDGFEWVECADREQSVLAFLRRGSQPTSEMLVVAHFTPVPRYKYRIGVPRAGTYDEVINTDATQYGGSGIGNFGAVVAEAVPAHGHQWSISLSLPPLAALYFRCPPG